jgi:hypothetical protein
LFVVGVAAAAAAAAAVVFDVAHSITTPKNPFNKTPFTRKLYEQT